MGWWKNAFAMPSAQTTPLTPRQEEILERLADEVVRRRMTLPAVLFLETVRPLNFVGSQVLVFFAPIARSFLNPADYDEVVAMMEVRGNVEKLLARIESKQKQSDSPTGGDAG